MKTKVQDCELYYELILILLEASLLVAKLSGSSAFQCLGIDFGGKGVNIAYKQIIK